MFNNGCEVVEECDVVQVHADDVTEALEVSTNVDDVIRVTTDIDDVLNASAHTDDVIQVTIDVPDGDVAEAAANRCDVTPEAGSDATQVSSLSAGNCVTQDHVREEAAEEQQQQAAGCDVRTKL